MTGRQRILAAFRGEPCDRVPFCPNIYYWFYSRRAKGTLPDELKAACHPFDALHALGADILARWDTQAATSSVYTGGECEDAWTGESPFSEAVVTAFNTYPRSKSERHSRIRTPYGELTQTWKLSEEAAADFISEYWWKTWEQYPAIRHVVEHTNYAFDAASFRTWKQRAGDDGVMMVHLTQSPLKTFHWLAGPENASLFAVDHPGEMRELAEIHEAKVLALLEEIVDEPAAEVFISLDNLDSAFFPPGFYRDYCASYFSRVADVIHSRGKIFVVHACGRNKVLLPLVGASRVDCLEGLTPPPMGDVPLGQARAMCGYENFTVNGGMDAPRLEMREGEHEALDRYVGELFGSMRDKRHFIFASSCSTPYPASWDNLRRLHDAALEYGRM